MNEVQLAYLWLMPSAVLTFVVIQDYPNVEELNKTNYLTSIFTDVLISMVIVFWPVFAIAIIYQLMKQK